MRYYSTFGDKILVHVVTKLKDTEGNVVRYGGDEFFVIYDNLEFPSKLRILSKYSFYPLLIPDTLIQIHIFLKGSFSE